jgi:hypothetical protein
MRLGNFGIDWKNVKAFAGVPSLDGTRTLGRGEEDEALKLLSEHFGCHVEIVKPVVLTCRWLSKEDAARVQEIQRKLGAVVQISGSPVAGSNEVRLTALSGNWALAVAELLAAAFAPKEKTFVFPRKVISEFIADKPIVKPKVTEWFMKKGFSHVLSIGNSWVGPRAEVEAAEKMIRDDPEKFAAEIDWKMFEIQPIDSSGRKVDGGAKVQ